MNPLSIKIPNLPSFRPPFEDPEAVFARDADLKLLYEAKNTFGVLATEHRSLQTSDFKLWMAESKINWLKENHRVVSALHTRQLQNRGTMKDFKRRRNDMASKGLHFRHIEQYDEAIVDQTIDNHAAL